jgi:hypothetical protein
MNAGADISHEKVRFWWQRFRTKFAAEIRKRLFYGRTFATVLAAGAGDA